MLTGKCLCEGVRIEIEAPLGPVIACHCSLCRRSTGSAFNPNASVPAERFRITTGHELVREFSRAPGAYRAFCSRCGAPLYGRSDAYPEIIRVRLGTLESTGGARLIAHIFAASKADCSRSMTALSSSMNGRVQIRCAILRPRIRVH